MGAGGQILGGRYRLERLIGSGGFADVYLATDLGPLGRRVAVKILHPHLVRHGGFLEQFRREAAIIAQLKHPHILDVYDFNDAGGTLYLVMPYLDGGTLDDRLRAAGRFAPPRAAAYLGQIAGALDYAHARRIVHRDVKPQNFLLDGRDNLLLADFGLAKLLQEAAQSYSGSGVAGTLAYMAPELFRNQPGPAGDQYAVGCMAFEFLTGRPPYTGTAQQLTYAHNFTPAPTLAERGGGDLPPALEPVIARALAKRPEDRYPSVGDFARAFAAALAGDAEALPPAAAGSRSPAASPARTPGPSAPPTPAPAALVRRRRVGRVPLGRVGALGGVGALLLLLALTAFVAARGWPGGPAPTATRVAVAASPPRPTATLAPPVPFAGVGFATLVGHASPIYALTWSPDGRVLASASSNGVVRLWSPEGREIATLPGHAGLVRALAWSPDSRTLASGAEDRTIRLWGADGTALRTITDHTDWVWALAWSPDGQTLASASEDRTVRLWSPQGAPLRTLIGHLASVRLLAWSPDGAVLASGASDTSVRLWGPTGAEIATLTGHTDAVRALAWSPDSRILASAGRDAKVRLWTPDGREIGAFPGHTEAIVALAWSPDGRLLASGSYDDTVRLWTPQGRAVATLQGHEGTAVCLAWSPDGQRLASGSFDYTARIWSPDGRELAALKGHENGVWALAWSPDARLLATASEDGTVRLWR